MSFFILLSWISIAGFSKDPRTQFPSPAEGVLDLRGTEMDQNSFISLNGEWEFFWKQLLTPDNYPANISGDQRIIVNVPSYWTEYTIDSQKLPGSGYGTYGLSILLPADYNSTLCFDVPIFDCAYRFFLDGRLIESNGTVGTTEEEEEPWYAPSSFCYVPRGDTVQILIQVSNFHHRRGGFWKGMFVGGSTRVLERIEKRSMFNYSTIGVLFFFTFFFIIFFFFSRRDKYMLFFALTALGILIRTVNSGQYFSNSFVDAPWAWQVRMEYLGSYLAFIFGTIFLHRIYPTRYMIPVVRINTILFSAASISLFLLPVRLFAYGMLIYQPLVVLLLANYLVISLIGTFRGKLQDAVFFFSLGFFIYTLINDILVANSASAAYSNYLSPVSFQLFIFAVAVVIIVQWVKNYNERLALESALRFKNKVLSVIAHDLKNPVASIAQFTDLLATKKNQTTSESILNSLQESSQAAVNLLENLLYWSRSQSEELVVVPEEFDIPKVVDEVFSLFTHMSQHKEVQLEQDVTPDLRVYADRMLVHTVIRNLVSNALKFTQRHGKVTIRARSEGKMVSISVIDTGVGIKPEILEQFELNGKLQSSTGTEKEHGTGLGLQLVRDLVTRNGGTLHIRSQPGEGSEFTFTVPAHKPSST